MPAHPDNYEFTIGLQQEIEGKEQQHQQCNPKAQTRLFLAAQFGHVLLMLLAETAPMQLAMLLLTTLAALLFLLIIIDWAVVPLARLLYFGK